MPRSLAIALVFVASALAPAVGHADKGEVSLGAGAVLRWPRAAGGELGARLGVGDFLAIDARVGGGMTSAHGLGYAEGGVVALFDVLTWVPELRLAVGAELQGGDVSPVAHATLGLRRFLTADVSTALEAGGAWTPHEWRGTLGLTFWFAVL